MAAAPGDEDEDAPAEDEVPIEEEVDPVQDEGKVGEAVHEERKVERFIEEVRTLLAAKVVADDDDTAAEESGTKTAGAEDGAD